MMTLHTLPLRFSNVHLAVGAHSLLFDTGSPHEAVRILAWIAKLGAPTLSAIVLTHCHADHAGSARALRQATGAPIFLAKAEHATAMQGKGAPLQIARPSAWPLRFLVPHRFDPFTPDGDVTEAVVLPDCGIRAIATPGHTPGSTSFLLSDGHAIAGDILMGGYMGGAVRPRVPRRHYFVEDKDQAADSLLRLLAAGASMLHVGHGGPLRAHDIRNGVRG